MKRLTALVCVALLALTLISLLAACANPIGSRSPASANQLPAVVQPYPGGQEQSDPQAAALEQALTDLANQLNATDVLDDLK